MDIRNAESAYTLGTERFKSFLKKFMGEWYAPMIRTQMAIQLRNAPPGTEEQMSEELMQRIVEKFGFTPSEEKPTNENRHTLLS